MRRKATAKDLDAKLKRLVREARTREAEIAYTLLEMKRRGLFRHLGYPRIQDYAHDELDLSRGKARALIETAAALERLPRLRRAFCAGALAWTKARTVGRVATPDDEEVWLHLAEILTNRGLEQKVAKAKGERPLVRVTLELSEADAADLEAAITSLREERGSDVPLGRAVAELARRSLGPPVDRPGYQIVIHECPTCERATRAAREVDIDVPAAELQAARADAETLDLTAGGTGRRKASIRPSVRRAVIARDRGRCVHCGTRAWLHIHHLDPGRGDPDALRLLCSACHQRLVHGGHVQIEDPKRMPSPLATRDAAEPLGVRRSVRGSRSARAPARCR